MKTIYYLQEDYQGLPKGMPLVKAEPTSAHYQAKATVGNSYPCGYYRPIGTHDDKEVVMIPYFEGLLDTVHPNDPSVTGPYVSGNVTIQGKDLLDKNISAIVVYKKQYPNMHLDIVFNTVQDNQYANIVFKNRPKGIYIHKELEMVEAAIQLIKEDLMLPEHIVLYPDH